MIETYIPLYRKYRPQDLNDLVGQDIVSTALGNAFKLNKIAHAYLFCGPRGTGKTSTARILAKSLNCEQGPTVTPCQVCASCVAITTGTPLDVLEIDAASNNGVEHIRDLTDKVQFSPIQGKYKIYIIDEVHMLSTAAFNALLKTLEEPPPNVVFIFATTEAHKVLQTIISRCQRFDFSRITRDQIEERLRYVSAQENIAISPEAVTLIARHSRGGLRDALGLLDQVAVLGRSQTGEPIAPSVVLAFIGVLEAELLLSLTQALLEKVPEKVLGEIRVLQARGIEPVQMVKGLSEHFRNLLLAKACGPSADPEGLDISPDIYPKLCEQAKGFETEEIPQILSRLAGLETQLKHSQQPQLWFEVAMLDLCYRHDIHILKQLAERVSQLEALLQSGERPAQAAPKPKQAVYQSKPPEVSQTVRQTPPAKESAEPNLGGIWQQVVEAVQHTPTKFLVKDHFSLLSIKGDAAAIGYSKDTLYETFRRAPEKVAALEQAFQTVLGFPVKLRFEQAASASQAAQSVPVTSPQSQTMAQAFSEPVATASQPQPVTAAVSAPVATQENSSAEVADAPIDYDLIQAKQYVQDLLQARSID